MKVRTAVVIGCLVTLMSGCYCDGMITETSPSSYVMNECQCVARTCKLNTNDCLDFPKCCEVFGNIGNPKFESLYKPSANVLVSGTMNDSVITNNTNGYRPRQYK